MSSLLQKPIPESYWVLEGRLLAGEYPLAFSNPQANQLRLLSFLQQDFDTFVDLTMPGENQPYAESLAALAAAQRKTALYRRFGIGDFGLPRPEQMRQILAFVEQRLAEGGKVYLHCFGGIGRTGTTVACYLVQQGRPPAEALRQLAEWWQQVPKSAHYPHSPETLEQEAFVLAWQLEQT